MTSELHREPFVHLVDVAADRALIAGGAFWFTRDGAGSRWEIVDDEQLPGLVGRRTCIGADTEGSDDRAQLDKNVHLHERFTGDQHARRSNLGS